MKHILLVLCAALIALNTYAQPDLKKAAKSVFTLKTFDTDGNMLSSTNGVFIGTGGEAISNLEAFNGASRAIIIDSQGKEYAVECILGANDMYDVIKFRVATKRSTAMPVSTDTLTGGAKAGSTVWLVPYSAKKTPEKIEGKVSKAELFLSKYTYYTIDMEVPDNTVGCPFINDKGEIVGILQQPAQTHSSTSYAVSAKFAADMQMKGLSINDKALRNIKIKKDLPDDISQAILTLFMAANTADSTAYKEVVDDFIKKFPNATDGYTARAQLNVNINKFDDAAHDMEQAIKVADKKDDAHYNYARIIFQKEINKNSVSYPKWSLDKAAEEAETAFKINPIPVYKQLKGQILYAKKDYDDAYNTYKELIADGNKTADIYYEAAKCREAAGDTATMLSLLDSAVNTFDKPYLKAAAPYILVRAQALIATGKYRQAVMDFNEYEALMPTSVNDNFYYIRSQAEVEGRMFQQAINDLKKAISMNPANTLYHAEKASIEVRVGLYDEAMASAKECIRLDAEYSDGYLFLGLAQCLKGNKTEGTANLQKAKELGDPQAQSLIDQYSK